MTSIPIRAVVAGLASGSAVILDEPISFWGGFDATTGCIIDRLHPQCGLCLTGGVVFMYSGRGSSSASSVLAEAIRLGTAPAAFVLQEPDGILALGSLVGEELYSTITPIVLAEVAATSPLRSGQTVTISETTLTIN